MKILSNRFGKKEDCRGSLSNGHLHQLRVILPCLLMLCATCAHAQWIKLPLVSPDLSLFGAISTVGMDVVLVAGKDVNGLYFVLRSVDRGESFIRTYTSSIGDGNPGILRSISNGDAGLLFIVGGHGRIYSTDSGSSWRDVSELLPDSIAVASARYLWSSVAISLDSIVLMSGTDESGAPILLRGALRTGRWEIHPTSAVFNRMQCFGMSLIKAHEYGAYEIHESRDAGVSWLPLQQSNDYSLWDMHFIDSLHGWHASGGGARRTIDGGRIWLSSPKSACSTVCFADTSTGWILDYDLLGHSEDGGKTYVDQSKNVEMGYQGGDLLSVASPMIAYFTNATTIYRTTNGGGLTSSFNDEMDGQSPSTDEIVIHPNPSDEWCEMSLRPDIVDHVQLFDDTGRLVRSVVVTDRNTYTLNTADLPSGVYRVIVRGEHTTRSKCLVIVH